jgi:hypothetical protein
MVERQSRRAPEATPATPTAPTEPSTIDALVTVEQLRQAVADYDLLLPSEVEKAYQTLLAVPLAGVKIAQGLQQAMLANHQGRLPQDRVLDAAVVPAFLIGVLVGRLGSSGHQRP